MIMGPQRLRQRGGDAGILFSGASIGVPLVEQVTRFGVAGGLVLKPNLASAQSSLGRLYEDGQGVAQLHGGTAALGADHPRI